MSASSRKPTREGNLYYNAQVSGPDPNSSVDSVVAVYDVTRDRPILSRPSDWYVSVVRLTVNLNSAPIFVCPIVPNQPNPNLTPWVVGISYGGNWYPQNLLWQTSLYAPPLGANPIDYTYMCFNIDTFVSMVNVAIAAAYAVFQAANPLAAQAVANQAPFIIYDDNSQLFSWVWHQSWATTPPATEPLGVGQARVGLNYSLLAQFDGFRNLLVSLPNGEGAHYVWENTGDNAYTLNGYTNTFFSQQSYNCAVLLSNLRRIIVTSSSLPIVPENVATNTSTGGTANSSGVSATSPILADFVPQFALSGDIRSTVYYVPRAQYRLVNMQSDTPLNRIQLSFSWQSTDGTIYPIQLARNAIAEAKLGFFRKDLYDTGDVVDAIEMMQ